MPLDLPLALPPAPPLGLTRGASVPRVAIRAVRPDDAEKLAAFYRDLSPTSRTRRFHGGMAEVPPDLLALLTRGIDAQGGALVAVVAQGAGETIVGEARYVVEQPHEAEFAIAVTDRMQGNGLGKRLLGLAVDLAGVAGVRRLYGDVQYDNRPMLALAAAMGFVPRRAQADPRLQRVERLFRART